ncbi:MAG TPA: methyltransferase domain-containing protein [Sedimentisphaerales bacterium]|nr:methyltransferase domain-containing protein [Sedimentisphaerales bacterium]
MMNLKYLFCILKNPSWIPSMRLTRFFNNKNGIVIGGHLRWFFKSLLCTPRKIINVDNCQADNVDYVTDAANLHFAADETMDFVCSSHVLEHLANPLKAIAEWKRVIKKGGIIYAGVPDKRHTFDSKRNRTPLSHLIEDFEKNTEQTDKTHVSEFLENFYESDICKKNTELRKNSINLESNVHHHVWVLDDVKEIFEYMDLKIIYGPFLRHDTIHIIGQK